MLGKEERIRFLKFETNETGTQKIFQFESQKLNENTQNAKKRTGRRKNIDQ